MTKKSKPIHLLSLSLDQNLLLPQMGDSLSRQIEYAQHFEHSTILVMNYGSKLHPASYDKLDIIPVNAWNKFDLLTRTYLLAKKIYRNKPYQIITAQDPIGPGRVGLWLKNKHHLPLNIQVHADIFSKAWQKQRFVHRFYQRPITEVLRQADSIRVVSESLKTKLTSEFKDKNIFVAPIRVDLSLFWKPACYKPKIKKLISVGRLAPEKNFPLLLESFAKVCETHPEITLTIVGDGPEKTHLQKQASSMKLKVSFVGQKSSSEVAALLHHHDIFVLGSLYEGWGLAYVEAFAAGLPVVTTSVASVGELLQPDQNCLITDPPTLELFATHITRLITHPEEVYRLARNGQMWVKQNLESSILVNQWISRLKETCY